MKLLNICESIAKSDFYDFYVLAYAYHESLPNHKDIVHHLNNISDGIIQDHMQQIGDIIIRRIGTEEEIAASYSDNTERQAILRKIWRQIENKERDVKYLGWFTGSTWINLAKWYANLRSGISPESKIKLIDELHNAFHHGGYLIDYMSESDWLEPALHERNIGSIAQLLRHASPYVKNLVGRSIAIGHERGEITDLHKLYVAFNKLRHNACKSKLFNGTLKVQGLYWILATYKNDRWSDFCVRPHLHGWENSIKKHPELIKISKKGTYHVSIKENGHNLLILYENSQEHVEKPIVKYIKLAQDISEDGANSAAGLQATRVQTNIKFGGYI